jgi:tetratricopeptide (TPR) repeat protein
VQARYELATLLRRTRRALELDVGDLAEQALALALRDGHEEQICMSLADLANVYVDKLPLVGLVVSQAAVARAREKHQPLALARSLAILAACRLELDLDDAVEAADEGLKVAVSIGDVAWKGWLEANLVIALFAQGDWRRLESGLLQSEQREDVALSSIWIAVEGHIAASRGEAWRPVWPPDEMEGDLNTQAWHEHADAVAAQIAGDFATAARLALAAMEDLLTFGSTSDDFAIQWPIAVDLALQAGDELALARLLEMVRIDDETDHSISVGLQAHRHRARGLLAVRAGDALTAEHELRSAIDGYEEWHSRLQLRRTEADLGLLLAQQGRLDEGLPLVDRALDFYREIGATAWLSALQSRLPSAAAMSLPRP